MNSSRPVAALAAVAIGFGVTLVGVALADDSDGADEITVVETEDADDTGTGADDVGDGAQEPDDIDDDAAEDSDDGDGLPPIEIDEVVDDAAEPPAEERPPGTTAPEVVPDTTPTTASESSTVPDAPTPRPPSSDEDVFDDLGDIECVNTISVEFTNGDRFDFVVAERGTGGTWLVIDVDGVFELSQDDFDVARITEVRREVLFIGGAAIEFLETCDDLGGSLGTETSGQLEQGVVRDFPCLSTARSQVRELLADTEMHPPRSSTVCTI